MVNYRRILELYFEGVSQRTIGSSTGHSRNTVSDVIQRAKKLGVEDLNDIMTNQWLEVLLFPEKQAIEKGYFPDDWEKVHKELQKKNVTLSLLHYEYARKYKLTMPIRKKPDILFPFLILLDGKSAGFILIATPPHCNKGIDYFINEFFLLQSLRGPGIAEHAANKVFEQFNGEWELFTNPLEKNIVGQKFWRKTISNYDNPIFKREIDDWLYEELLSINESSSSLSFEVILSSGGNILLHFPDKLISMKKLK